MKAKVKNWLRPALPVRLATARACKSLQEKWVYRGRWPVRQALTAPGKIHSAVRRQKDCHVRPALRVSELNTAAPQALGRGGVVALWWRATYKFMTTGRALVVSPGARRRRAENCRLPPQDKLDAGGHLLGSLQWFTIRYGVARHYPENMAGITNQIQPRHGQPANVQASTEYGETLSRIQMIL